MIKDLTKGAPIKLILLFSVPLLIGNIFQQLYNLADIVIVGRTLGVQALASVGAVAPLFFLIMFLVNFSSQKVSAVGIMHYMKSCFLNTGDLKTEDYYCGITNDIQANKSRHKVDDYVVVCQCPNASIASEVERLLGQDGFDVGERAGNGGADDSVYVYMYKKTKDTQE